MTTKTILLNLKQAERETDLAIYYLIHENWFSHQHIKSAMAKLQKVWDAIKDRSC